MVQLDSNNDYEIQQGKFHIRQPEVINVEKELKIFQFDSNENQNKEISPRRFLSISCKFFVWNQMFKTIFNA
jgi:hypothetical protein